jgi:hypothetical protein
VAVAIVLALVILAVTSAAIWVTRPNKSTSPSVKTVNPSVASTGTPVLPSSTAPSSESSAPPSS